MAVKSFNPVTPTLRYRKVNSFAEITKTKPERKLTRAKRKSGGRNSYGRMTSRGIGGGNRQRHRLVDFKRNKHGVVAKVVAIEYDPLRSARLALLEYADGEKRYILAPVGLTVGAEVVSGSGSPIEVGNCLPLNEIPPSTTIHNLELTVGRGAQMVRSAGSGATLMSLDAGLALIKLPSGELRKLNEKCTATIGQVGNTDHNLEVLGKAGITRHKGRRGKTRAVAKNPVDHPMGGGAGKTSGGGHPVTPWGVITRGFKTRVKRKPSDKFIVERRNKKRK